TPATDGTDAAQPHPASHRLRDRFSPGALPAGTLADGRGRDRARTGPAALELHQRPARADGDPPRPAGSQPAPRQRRVVASIVATDRWPCRPLASRPPRPSTW